MKKIMFNDKYGLTAATLRGDKTMTRRIIPIGLYNQIDWKAVAEGNFEALVDGEGNYHDIRCYCTYKVGDVVAIAQSYSNLREVLAKRDFKRTDALYDKFYRAMQMGEVHDGMPGWGNKMFVKAEYMPHRIRITDLWFERLQDISDEDCLKEGVEKWLNCYIVSGIMEKSGRNNVCFDTPREAFASLIDRISGRGTWESNPWVIAYTYELVKED